MSQTNSAARRYASLVKAADYLDKCSISTIRRMIDRGDISAYRLPGSRLIRVDLNELDAAMTTLGPAQVAS